MTDSLVPLVELYGQTDDFILRYVKRLHHFTWFQHTILCVEVPPPFHLILVQKHKCPLAKKCIITWEIMTKAETKSSLQDSLLLHSLKKHRRTFE